MDFQPLTNYLDSIPLLGVPGSDCIVQQGYDVVYRHQVGCSDRENAIPMDGHERFFLYSASKIITCVAALQLFEQGKFLMSDPLYTIFPEYRTMTIEHLQDNMEKKTTMAQNPITIGQLFTMTAGFNYNLEVDALKQVVADTGGSAPTLEVIRAFAKAPLHYEPGTHWSYGLAHDVLGGVVESISGQTLGQYMETHIFAPLEMKQTGFQKPDGSNAPTMQQYRRDPETGVVSLIPLENAYVLGRDYQCGGAGLISTVEDYSKFVLALANGGVGKNGAVILAPRTIELMATNHLDQRLMADYTRPQLIGYGYGLGVRTLVDKAKGGSLSPLGEFGWSGAAGAYILIDPVHKISMFYAQHMLDSLEPHIHPRLRNILYTCI